MNCLLCLEDKDDVQSLIDALSDEGQSMEVQKIVEQHFWLRFEENPLNSKRYVCRICWSQIVPFHQFYVRVEQAHNPLQEIALKLDCDVIIDTQPLPFLDVSAEAVEIKTEPFGFLESLDDKSLSAVLTGTKNRDSNRKSMRLNDSSNAQEAEPQSKANGKENQNKEENGGNGGNANIQKKSPNNENEKENENSLLCEEENKLDDTTEDTSEVKPSTRRRGRPKKTICKDIKAKKTALAISRRSKRVIANSLASKTNKSRKLAAKKMKADNSLDDSSEHDSDSDPEFNDVDYNGSMNDCDSEIENGKRRKSQSNEKYMITRQSDAYIAANFKLSCCLCNEDLNDFNYLKMHFRSKHKVRGYVYCCQKKFIKRGLLVDHLRTHEDPEYFKCPTCEKVMADRRCLDIHLKLHEGNRERVFQCTICTKGFFKKAIYNRHMLLHIPEDEKKEICPTCKKAFPTKYILKQHIHLTHLNTYASICDVCGKAVRGGRELFQRHMTQHTGETLAPVQCQICGTTVTTKYGLSRHMRTMHNEEQRQPLECKICSKVSPSLQAHKSHMKYMHNTERKHQCPMCKKAFKRPTELKEHLSTHTGEILYTCPHCPKTFKSNANMHSHRKKMHRAEWEERRQQRFKNPPIVAANASETEKTKYEQSDEFSHLSLEPNAITTDSQNLSKAEFFEPKSELFTSLAPSHPNLHTI